MLDGAALIDLLGSKVLAGMSFRTDPISEELAGQIIQEYYGLVQKGTPAEQVHLTIGEVHLCVCRINDVTLLTAVSSVGPIVDEDLMRLTKLHGKIVAEVNKSSVRDFKGDFEELAKETLLAPVRICFVSSNDPSDTDKTGTAVQTLLDSRISRDGVYTKPAQVGPYLIQIMRCEYGQIERREWTEYHTMADIFALVVSEPLPASDRIEETVLRIRDKTDGPIVVVPGSDDELEFARAVEFSYGADLCDSVSERPSNLIVAVLAIAGYSDMHPELALKAWKIEPGFDGVRAPTQRERTEHGHQAFFVVDRRDGAPVYSYYYDERSQLLEMAPNIIAAITSFKIDKTSPTSTSVFRTGELSYITIERDMYVFTLVTGKHSDVEPLRERFSFLPDLFKDEVPEPMEDPTDLFRSPPFTLKLLATLPPQKLGGRIAPVQTRALIWERFEHPAVGDFLEAVWQRLDGSLVMSRLVPGTNPEIILGAIHLLHRLGAVAFHLKITPNDVPMIKSRPDAETLSLYENLPQILELVDGELSIESIGKASDLQPSVLIAVFAELDKRGIVAFADTPNTDTKP